MKFLQLYIICFFLGTASGIAQEWSFLKKVGIGSNLERAGVLESTLDSDGNLYIAGIYSGKIVLGNETHIARNTFSSNLFVAKLDKCGNFIWSNVVQGGEQFGNPVILFIDSQGGLIVGGQIVGEQWYEIKKLNRELLTADIVNYNGNSGDIETDRQFKLKCNSGIEFNWNNLKNEINAFDGQRIILKTIDKGDKYCTLE